MKIQTIKETVRGAQDILARMALCQYIRDIQDQVADANESLPASSYHLNNPETGATFWTPFSSKSPGPPQSLGELCIELTQDRLGFDNARIWRYRKSSLTSKARMELGQLRRAMYGRHLPPTLDFGDGLTTPHNPAVCLDSECPIHGNPTWYVDQSRPRNEACIGDYHQPAGDRLESRETK